MRNWPQLDSCPWQTYPVRNETCWTVTLLRGSSFLWRGTRRSWSPGTIVHDRLVPWGNRPQLDFIPDQAQLEHEMIHAQTHGCTSQTLMTTCAIRKWSHLVNAVWTLSNPCHASAKLLSLDESWLRTFLGKESGSLSQGSIDCLDNSRIFTIP